MIATPEPDALREASYFVERLAEERMPLAGLILNRVHAAGISQLSAARSVAAAETLETMIPNEGAAPASSPRDPVMAAGLAAAALRLHAERMNLGQRERRVAGSFVSAHPAVPVIEIPALPEDVHDLAGLRRIGGCFGHAGSRAEAGGLSGWSGFGRRCCRPRLTSKPLRICRTAMPAGSRARDEFVDALALVTVAGRLE